MPAKQAVTGLAQMVGKEGLEAHEKTKDLKPDVGGDLPGGIEGGIAKIKVLRIGKFEKGDNIGKPFFMMQAVVVSPVEFNGEKIGSVRHFVLA